VLLWGKPQKAVLKKGLHMTESFPVKHHTGNERKTKEIKVKMKRMRPL
jgi:hypothetical protein